MNRKNFFILIFGSMLVVNLLLVFSVQAKEKCTYYVNGSVSVSGSGTKHSPFKTIQEAADVAQAGEHVCIRPGTYQERVVPKNSGQKRKRIVYQKDPQTKGKVIIYGLVDVEYKPGEAIFIIYNKSFIKIQSLHLQNSNGHGIYVGHSRFVTLENNHTYDTWSSGIGVWNSDNIKVLDNEIVFATNWQNQENTAVQEDLTIADTSNFVVKGNYVHDGADWYYSGSGIDIKQGSRNGLVYGNIIKRIDNKAHIYIDSSYGDTRDIKVFRNLIDCENAGVGRGLAISSEQGDTIYNIDIFNNVIANCSNYGLIISSWNKNGHRNGIHIINNTFYNNGGYQYWGGGVLVQTENVSDIVIRNNIFSHNAYWSIAASVPIADKIQVDHNLIYKQAGHYQYANQYKEINGRHAVYGNPNFQNPAENDFQLQTGSKAINKGSRKSAPKRDYLRTLRPQNKKIDIGAFEFAN